MTTIRSLLSLAACVATLSTSASAQAARSPATVPYGPGESATYQVKLGGVAVGSGSLRMVGLEWVNDHLTYHARLAISGGIPLARVDDKLDTWIDVNGLFSRRFRQDLKEIRYRRYRTYDMFPEQGLYRRTDTGKSAALSTDRPLDDVSFLYYARTLPLRVGETYTLNQYFKDDGNPVVLKVLRRETVTVPAGTFRTVVVQPIIKTDGLFGQGGEAEVFLSDDDRRILVQLRSRVPVVGSLSLHLREYTPGTPLTAMQASRVPARP